MGKKRNLNIRLLMSVFLLVMVCATAAGQTIFVDANATGANDGSNWEDAYNYLQDALQDADSNPDVNEIWVAAGTYTPDSNSANPDGSGDRTATFQLINGVAIYGGYAGYDEPDPNFRDVNDNETILSGDLNGDDVGFTNIGDNSYHVVTGSETDETAALDGFTITAGNANGSLTSEKYGGGMSNYDSSPTLTNCTFRGNSAWWKGGGMYNYTSAPTITNCSFIGNSVLYFGGGIYNYDSDLMVVNCTFSDNLARDGGGMFNDTSDPNVTNCTFIGNTADNGRGGGLDNRNSSPILTNCTFSGNSAGGGGGMRNLESNARLINCRFIGNYTDWSGGAMDNQTCHIILINCEFKDNSTARYGGAIRNSLGSLTLDNCVFINNAAAIYGGALNNAGCQLEITNCDFKENSAGHYGGGMINGNCNLIVIDCLFQQNTANDRSAAIHTGGGEQKLINCSFIANTVPSWGGAMVTVDCNEVIFNCIFSDNHAGALGGAIYFRDGANSTLTNCTFCRNTSPAGSSFSCSSPFGHPCHIALNNSILWDQENTIYNDGLSQIDATYSAIYGGWPGEGNIDEDPLFIDPNGLDGIPGTEDDDLHLLLDSPCIDAGDNTAVPADTTDLDGDGNTTEPIPWDLDGNPRIVDGNDDGNSVVDMGAYEFFVPASIQAIVDIDPDTLNLKSKGQWITCYIWPPEGYDVADIDPDSVWLEEVIAADWMWLDEEEQVAMAKFSRCEVQDILDIGQVELTISGELTDGTRFEGTDTIKVIDKGNKK